MKNQLFCILLFLLASSFTASAQIPSFDKIEMLYDQGHYKMVYRKANMLLDKPDFDFSYIPSYYKSLSLFQLSQNENWYKHHPEALKEARELFLKVIHSSDGNKIFEAHLIEIVFLKNDIFSWIEELKEKGETDKVKEIQLAISGLFDKIPSVDKEGELKGAELSKVATLSSKQRNDIVDFALKQIGVPYVWSGVDPTGFDCSGFTGYVMKNFGVVIPRRALDQEKESLKVKQKNAQKGDLIFFDNGSGVSHVGIVVSEKGAPLQMIHASSSKGVIITDITQSDYWLQRIYSIGTFVE